MPRMSLAAVESREENESSVLIPSGVRHKAPDFGQSEVQVDLIHQCYKESGISRTSSK